MNDEIEFDVDKFNIKYFGKKASYKNSSFITDKHIKKATEDPFKGVEKKLKRRKELL